MLVNIKKKLFVTKSSNQCGTLFILRPDIFYSDTKLQILNLPKQWTLKLL